MKHFLVITGTVLCLIFRATPAAEADAVAVPDADQQARAAKAIDEIYGKELRAARTEEQRQSLAQKMLTAAIESADDPAGRYMLLLQAHALACEAGSIQIALNTDQELSRDYKIDSPGQAARTLNQLARTVRPGTDTALLIDMLDSSIESAISSDNYDLARRLAELTATAAARSNDPAIKKRTSDRVRSVQEIAAAYTEARSALDAARLNPGNKQNDLVAGKFLCFWKGDWQSGLPLLQGCADPALAALAHQELHASATAEAEVALGDSWWEMAEQQNGTARGKIRSHAADLYRKALPAARGLTKARLQSRLDTAEAGGNAGAAGWTDLLIGVNPKTDAPSGQWSVHDGQLVLSSDSTQQQRVMLPYTISGDYDLSVQFSRVRGDGAICIYVPAGEGECIVALSGWGKQLSALFSSKFTAPDGASVPNDRFTNGQVYQLDVSVRLSGKDVDLRVLRDQRPLMHWRGPQADLELPKEWSLPQPESFGIGGDDASVVKYARARPITGRVDMIQSPSR